MYQSSTTYVYNTYTPSPEAYITKGKNRLKQNGLSVYLNNNDEFELELFNPKSTSVLVKIKINGSYISNRGLVLKPGQRVFLDRYIDDAKKFLFTTYDVDGGNSAAMAAIANNGSIDFEFYDEQTPLSYTININAPTFFDGSFGNSGSPTFVCNSLSANGVNLGGYNYAGGTMDSLSYTSSVGTNGFAGNSGVRSKSVETGRVEKGGKSNTQLNTVTGDFSPYASAWVSWKILPQSQQPVQAGDLKNYCSGCGYRLRKDSWTFCPSCGNKL